MAEEQAASSGNQSLIARVFGSRIAQALGIIGVAFSLFQGLEPFLKFSRFMAYLVNHWRELTRGLWSWLASFVNLDIPPALLDVLTMNLFLILFFTRAVSREVVLDAYLSKAIRIGTHQFHLTPIYICASLAVVPVTMFLTLYVHAGLMWAAIVSIHYGILSGILIMTIMENSSCPPYGIYNNSARTLFTLIGLLALNYVGLYSHSLEAFIEKATQ